MTFASNYFRLSAVSEEVDILSGFVCFAISLLRK